MAANCTFRAKSDIYNCLVWVIWSSVFVYVFVLQISYPMWAPTHLKTPSQEYQYELPTTSESTTFVNSAGFVYEINGVRSAILQGISLISAWFLIWAMLCQYFAICLNVATLCCACVGAGRPLLRLSEHLHFFTCTFLPTGSYGTVVPKLWHIFVTCQCPVKTSEPIELDFGMGAFLWPVVNSSHIYKNSRTTCFR